MRDEEIDYSDIPELDEEVFAQPRAPWPPKNSEQSRAEPMPDYAMRREVAHWVQQYLSGGLSFDQLFALVPEDTEDEEVSELLDLIVHEPKQGGWLGAGPEEYARHMRRIRELVDFLISSEK